MAATLAKKDQDFKSEKEGKYLTFVLAGEEYGVSIRKVKEIIGLMPISKVPRTAKYVKGVINLRGKVIPVMDIRVKFDMEEEASTQRTCIIVVEINGKNGMVQIGILVDAVSEVLTIKSPEIEESPVLGDDVDTAFILGMAKMNNGVKILLDMDKVLFPEEIACLDPKSMGKEYVRGLMANLNA
jgi:purine-binding chemotaxis protein CheW